MTTSSQIRPWWGNIDVLLAMVWFMVAMTIALSVTGLAAAIGGSDLASEPVYAIFFGTATFQAMQALYPWLVSKRKGFGLAADWGFSFRLPDDIGHGVLIAMGCLMGAQVASYGAASIVGLEDIAEASNTDILTDNQTSLWLIGIIALVVVGAPFVEELLFRGLILKILTRSFGPVVAIILSSLLFAVLHWQPDATWQETVVLLSGLFVVGAILAVGAIKVGRIGPSIIAHLVFNSTGTIMTFV